MSLATGRSISAVADDPWALTLWTFWQMLDIERLQRMEREWAGMDHAHLMRIAYHDPKKLSTVAHQMRARHGLLPPREDVMKRAAKLMAAARTQPKRSARR